MAHHYQPFRGSNVIDVQSNNVYIYIYIYIYIYVCVCVYIYIYIYYTIPFV